MNTHFEATISIETASSEAEGIVPLQERSCVQVADSVEEMAEVILAASRLEVQQEAERACMSLFIP